ncbi:MAG: hypothetical protein ACP5R4_08935 [Armatimonadota bacterium]
MSGLRDLALLILGGILGYMVGKTEHLKIPNNLTTRFEEYYRTHTVELAVLGALTAVIIYLLATRPRGIKSRR